MLLGAETLKIHSIYLPTFQGNRKKLKIITDEIQELKKINFYILNTKFMCELPFL